MVLLSKKIKKEKKEINFCKVCFLKVQIFSMEWKSWHTRE